MSGFSPCLGWSGFYEANKKSRCSLGFIKIVFNALPVPGTSHFAAAGLSSVSHVSVCLGPSSINQCLSELLFGCGFNTANLCASICCCACVPDLILQLLLLFLPSHSRGLQFGISSHCTSSSSGVLL